MQLGVALIGVGMVGSTYAAAMSGLPGLRWTGALGARDGSGSVFMQKHGIAGRAYADVAEVAADPEVGFVILTTPPNARAEILDLLTAAGKPVLMEKPVERTERAARGLVEMCEARGVPLGIVLQHRASPVAQELRNRLAALGALRVAEIMAPWWRPQSYYDEPGRGTYARDGGGVMMTQAIHVLDLALQFTGPVADVVAMTATSEFHRMESEDFVSAGLRFENGAVGTLLASTASFPGRAEEIALHFENGSARMDRNVLRVNWQDGRSEVIGEQAGSGSGADPMAFSSRLHRAVIADFADSLANGRTPLASGRSALGVHQCIEAIEQAGRSGARVAVGGKGAA